MKQICDKIAENFLQIMASIDTIKERGHFYYDKSILTSPASRSRIAGTTYFHGWCQRSLSIFHPRMGQYHSSRTEPATLSRAKATAVKSWSEITPPLWSFQIHRKTMSAARFHPKMNRLYGTQNAFCCPGRNRTACSKAGSQDRRIQSGVFRERRAKPMGRTNRASI